VDSPKSVPRQNPSITTREAKEGASRMARSFSALGTDVPLEGRFKTIARVLNAMVRSEHRLRRRHPVQKRVVQGL
jgi:hypothetical protein